MLSIGAKWVPWYGIKCPNGVLKPLKAVKALEAKVQWCSKGSAIVTYNTAEDLALDMV